MPQCPICNTAIWVGQQYCTTCDHPLSPPEQEIHLCPQCGLRVTAPQEICEKCKEPPPEITGIPLTDPPRKRGLLLGGRGLFLGGAVILAVLLLFLFFNQTPESGKQIIAPPPQPIAAPAPETPKAPATAKTPETPPVPATATTPEPSKVPATATAPEPPKVAAAPAPGVLVKPAVSTVPEATASAPTLPRYEVNIDGLYVRSGPNMSEPHIATLKFKDEVELLEISGAWGKVRSVPRDIIGWSCMRYLKLVAPGSPSTVSHQQSPAPKEPRALSAKASQNM